MWWLPTLHMHQQWRAGQHVSPSGGCGHDVLACLMDKQNIMGITMNDHLAHMGQAQHPFSLLHAELRVAK
jgi:hypothetical protein